ncbi:MAG: tetratricopeptide repeat protein, partial [Desulfuromonadales bacterium]|nr:tetratricopeptide repeat protein [Desulfuromonadales bacterium]NIS39263.1 tetratricopeptide repeat protein [Desulfuromonadales bacterium]
MSFADALFAEGDYYRAITEYKRYLHHFPQGAEAPRAALEIGRSYLAGGRYEQAEEAFDRVRLVYPETLPAQKAFLLRAQSAYRQGDYSQARLLLEEGSDAGMAERFRARARYLLAWSYLEEARLEEAKKQLQRLAGETPRQLSAKLPAFADLPRKSPKLAGGLSAVLPGAGQLYVGRPRDAALAFLLNAAFILGIVESFDDGNEVVGAILLFFEG